MKKVFILAVLILSLAAMSFAQGGPYAMSVGTGVGSLSFASVMSWGNVNGDDATFTNATGSATTIWNGCFMLTDTANSANTYWMDKAGFSAHTSRPTDGTIANTATQLTNNGMTYAGLTGITSNLALNLSQPTVGDTAKATWAWTFNNANASISNLRMIFFVDGDINIGTSYANDLVCAITSDFGAYRTVCQGKSSSGRVDLESGIKIDCDNTITRFFGLSNASGPSYWWSNTAPYAPYGPQIVYKIDDSYANKIENDVNNDKIADAVQDSGMAIQVDFQVPASGSKTITFTATWGLNVIASEVGNWSLY